MPSAPIAVISPGSMSRMYRAPTASSAHVFRTHDHRVIQVAHAQRPESMWIASNNQFVVRQQHHRKCAADPRHCLHNSAGCVFSLETPHSCKTNSLSLVVRQIGPRGVYFFF